MRASVRLPPRPIAPLRFFGKYRGTCLNNIDPLLRARLKVQVPDELGIAESNWAEPCLPFASGDMLDVKTPPPGTAIWVKFESGNPDLPIWSGVRSA